MLYLAEVQKKTGFIGATKAELKLLACQRADQSWNPVPGEELISAEEVNNLNAGALVLADLNANRQVQRVQEAGRPLVSILQNFSRQLEKSKSLEEEVATWKDSLHYQSQELNSRKLKMEARLEHLQKIEDDFKTLEAQRQKIDHQRQQMEELQKEVERNRRELEEAWQHLRGEQRRLEEQQAQQPMLLDKSAAHQIQELLASLSNDVAPMREHLSLSFEILSNQQNILDQHWLQLEQQLLVTQQQQDEIDSRCLTLQNSVQQWQQAQTSLEQLLAQLQAQKSTLNSKQEYAQRLGLQLREQQDLYQQIYSLIETNDNVGDSQQVDIEALEKMPLDQLQQLVQEMQRYLLKASQFVNDQEEELKFKQQTIDELQAQLNQADEYHRINLEMQLADEQDCYRMLNETLVGQRQNLRQRQQILSQHQMVLRRRQEIYTSCGQEDKKADLRPILLQIEAQQQQKTEELQNLEQQISQLADSIQQIQQMIDHQAHKQETKRQELQNLEQNLLSLRLATATHWGRVNLYQEMLQPVQDNSNKLRQKLEAIAVTMAQLQETGDPQIQAIAKLQEILLNPIPSIA